MAASLSIATTAFDSIILALLGLVGTALLLLGLVVIGGVGGIVYLFPRSGRL